MGTNHLPTGAGFLHISSYFFHPQYIQKRRPKVRLKHNPINCGLSNKKKITHDLRHRAAVPSSFDLSPSETNPLERALTTHSWQGKWMINQQSVGMICNQLSMLIGKIIIISASSLGMHHFSDKSKSRNWTPQRPN